jgi:hypothetical protein
VEIKMIDWEERYNNMVLTESRNYQDMVNFLRTLDYDTLLEMDLWIK